MITHIPLIMIENIINEVKNLNQQIPPSASASIITVNNQVKRFLDNRKTLVFSKYIVFYTILACLVIFSDPPPPNYNLIIVYNITL